MQYTIIKAEYSDKKKLYQVKQCHLKDVHVEATAIIPRQEAMVVIDLVAGGAVVM